MSFENSTSGRRYLKWAGIGLALVIAACSLLPAQDRPTADRLIPGKIPERTPGHLKLAWPDEALIRKAREMHPFDLQGRMELAISAMTSCTDPDLSYLSYSYGTFNARPAWMQHCLGDFVDDMGRHTDAMWMIRSATNSRLNDQVVRKMARNGMDVVEDGIAWDPPQEPFTWYGAGAKPTDRWTHLPEASRMILGLLSYYRATDDPRALETVRSMVHQLYKIASKDDRYLWYPDFNYERSGDKILPLAVAHGRLPRVTKPADGAGGAGNWPAAFMGMMILPSMRYYEQTKDPVAVELVTRFTRMVMELMPDFAKNIQQVHTSTNTAAGIFMAGLLLNKPEYVDWAANVYRKFIALDYIPDFGWTPENTSRQRTKGHLVCETCTTCDLLELSVLMAMHRDEKYWDYAERVAMNQLLESQILRPDLLEKIPDRLIKPQPPLEKWRITTDRMAQRCLGAFGIFVGPNDFLQEEGFSLTQCCFGSGGRALYDVWYFASQEDAEAVRVNLQFSKRLPSALVISYMPGKAVLEVQMTKDKQLLVRKPGWADATKTRILVGGQERKPLMKGTYFDFGRLERGAQVRVEFPEELVNKKERIGDVEFSTVWRGNAVVKMAPAGEFYPLYQQGRERTDGVMPIPYINPHPINPF